MRKVILAFVFALALISCHKEDNPIKEQDTSLTGTWINPVFTDTLVTYDRSVQLTENQYGITFLNRNKVIERKNNSWCGTPPITTADYDGTWALTDDIVKVNIGFWGGTVDYTWKIISLCDSKLIISIVKTEYHQGK
jgi:hypothetical protein